MSIRYDSGRLYIGKWAVEFHWPVEVFVWRAPQEEIDERIAALNACWNSTAARAAAAYRERPVGEL